MREGGLRARPELRPAGHRPDRRVRRLRRRVRLATGRVAGATDDPSTDIARDVAADLERKGLLVATEQYAHRTPHCWRCGTELVFRLVDEWFIAMDPLREPISRSTRQITGCRRASASGARARLAREHGRLDDLQEALLGAGAADLGVHRLRGVEVIGSKDGAPGARGRGLGRVRRTHPASALDRRGQDRLLVLRRPSASHDRRREPVARRRHRRALDARLELGPRRLGEVVSRRT